MSVWDAAEMLLLVGVSLAAYSVGWWLRGQQGDGRAGYSCPGWCDDSCDMFGEDPADFRLWELDLARSADGLTAVADEVWPDGDR